MSFGLASATVRFGPVTALDAVDLSVEPGTIVVVVGADGAGKTTLSRVMVGLVPLAEGHVRWPGRARTGYQPESAGTWGDLSVVENLSFVASSHGMSDVARPRVDELLEVTGLVAAVDRPARALSGGMRQKLAVAMAMLASPDLLVLDEPTTGLDPVSRADVWRLLARAAGEGAAIVATTAYLDEADRARHVLVLDEGAVLVSGTADEIRASFPGRIVATDGRDDRYPSWRRGRQWRTWVGPVDAGVVDGADQPRGPDLRPDLDDVVMAASISRRQART